MLDAVFKNVAASATVANPLGACRGTRGFTLIELLIAVAIIAIVATLGVPGMQTWMQNNRIKATARSILSGLEMARAEAIRRNARVSFVLTDPGAAGNTSWCIIRSSTNFDCTNPTPDRLTQTTGEASSGIALTPTPNGAQAVTFDGSGRVCTVARGCTDPYTEITIGFPDMNPADSVDLRITIDIGGAARLCIPDMGDGGDLPPSGDPKRCA